MSTYLKKDLQAQALNRRMLNHLDLKNKESRRRMLYLVELKNKVLEEMEVMDSKYLYTRLFYL